MIKLYLVTTPKKVFYVVAEHPSEAESKVLRLLEEEDLFFSDYRMVTKIERIATNYKFAQDTTLITYDYPHGIEGLNEPAQNISVTIENMSVSENDVEKLFDAIDKAINR